MKINIDDCVIISDKESLPFTVKRVFYLYDILDGRSRGEHAHKDCHQLLIAPKGSFDVKVNDGKQIKTFTLNSSEQRLHIPPGIWATESNFSAGGVCLVFASHNYDESDYIRNYDDYLKYVKND